MASEKLKGNISKVSEGMLAAPKRLEKLDISTAARIVEDGDMLRIRVTAATFVAFGNSATMAAPSATTEDAIELPAAGTYLIAITGKYVRASANPARVEVH